MTGAGFGGCTVNLVRPGAIEALRAAVESQYPNRTGLVPSVLPVHAAAGAGRLH
jgi:galactokinase